MKRTCAAIVFVFILMLAGSSNLLATTTTTTSIAATAVNPVNVLHPADPVANPVVGVKQADAVSVIWDVTAMTSPILNLLKWQQVTGGYFWLSHVDGDATSVVVNFYTSFQASGDLDWAIYAPDNPLSNNLPTPYNLTMPAAASIVKVEAVPFPEGVKRAKIVYTFTGGTPTDVETVDMIPATR